MWRRVNWNDTFVKSIKVWSWYVQPKHVFTHPTLSYLWIMRIPQVKI